MIDGACAGWGVHVMFAPRQSGLLPWLGGGVAVTASPVYTTKKNGIRTDEETDAYSAY